MSDNANKIFIAKRVAQEFKDGDLINLGIGLPTLVSNYFPPHKKIWLQSENGFIGMGPKPKEDEFDPDIADAGGNPVTLVKGACCFDSATSFALIRGGHLDATVLGALQVDEEGNLANWLIPGKLVPGMGGAMDLVVGAKRVIVATEHNLKDGSPKILHKCTLPLTALHVVDLIVTELAVIDVTEDGLVLREVAPYTTIEEVIERTEANLIVPEEVKEMELEIA
jgi:acetate CoA/acetoacetate CoA-transferase beta subunit